MGVKDSKKALISTMESLDEKKIIGCAEAVISALRNGKKILAAGNGGSAADAQHLVAELVCTFEDRNRKGLAAYALNANTSILTAWGNDFGFDGVFKRQVEALGQKEDVLFSITTSGNSRNISLAMKKAKDMGMKNVLLCGKGGGEALKITDVALVVPSDNTPRIQECHVFAIHEICSLVDDAFGK